MDDWLSDNVEIQNKLSPRLSIDAESKKYWFSFQKKDVDNVESKIDYQYNYPLMLNPKNGINNVENGNIFSME